MSTQTHTPVVFLKKFVYVLKILVQIWLSSILFGINVYYPKHFLAVCRNKGKVLKP